MYSKLLRSLGHSVRVRLTLGLATVFLGSTIIAFLFMYHGLEAALLRSVDDVLREEVEECRSLYADKGVEGVKEELRIEENSHEKKEVFFRVVDRDGRVLAATQGTRWEPDGQAIAALPVHADVPQAGEGDFETVGNARVLHARLAPNAYVQVFHGLHENARLLREVRSLFLAVLAVLLLVSIAGTWYALSLTMAGVEAVTQAALDIAAGDLRRRVAIERGGREIERLAAAFNTMLDKVAALVAALRQVTDDIAHELRSPIARIRGTAEMAILQNPQDAKWQETTGSIVEECDELLALVNGMLDLAEMQVGLAEAAREPIDMPQWVRDTCELFAPAAEDAGITLVAEPAPSFHVLGDPQKLRRALANLIDNAVKYTPAGGKVTVSAALDGGEARITLRDTGVGIDPEDLPHLFERFYRADRSRSKGGKGLGLGIAQAILALHGGRIEASSTPGEGSTFTLILPAPAPAAPEPENPASDPIGPPLRAPSTPS